eukprot:885626-Amphidinium_carterae.1
MKVDVQILAVITYVLNADVWAYRNRCELRLLAKYVVPLVRSRDDISKTKRHLPTVNCAVKYLYLEVQRMF